MPTPTDPAAAKPEVSATPASPLGLALFALYCAFYGGFIALAVAWPEAMRHRLAFGVNLAVWYGLALIVGAVVLAAVYQWLRRDDAEPGHAVSGAHGGR